MRIARTDEIFCIKFVAQVSILHFSLSKASPRKHVHGEDEETEEPDLTDDAKGKIHDVIL